MKRPFLLPCLLAIAACGFHPQQSKEYQSRLNVDLSSVRVQVLQTRFDTPMEDHSHLGQMLETEIREGVNPRLTASEKLYLLQITLNEQDVALFINPDGTSSRGDIQYDSNYTLTQLADHKTLQAGHIMRTASYNTTQNADYASYVSQDDAKNRGILELAQAYKLRLSNLLPRLNGELPLTASPPTDQPATPVKSTGYYSSTIFGGPNETQQPGH